MKKSHLSLVVLAMWSFLLAQPFGYASKGYHIDKARYENASGEKATTYFYYDQNGMMNRALWTLDNNERWSKNDYEYDDKGNLCSAFREFSDSLFSYENFYYDKRGNKIAEYFYRSDGISGMASYTYKNNRCISAEYNKYKGWLNGTVHYHYKKNIKTHADIILNGEIRCVITYTYDENNNLIKEDWDFGGKWSQTFNYEYKMTNMKTLYYTSPYFRDLGPYRISKEDYTYNNKVGGPSYYHYGEGGNLEKKVFERSDGVKTTTQFSYEKNGQLKTSLRSYDNGDSGYFSYVYDEHDRLIKREYYKIDSLVAFESHLYDAEGKLIKTYLKNVDGWLTGSIDYEYNRFEKISSGVFHGEDGFDALLTFSYNDLTLLSELHWAFSTGDLQTYHYEYLLVK